VVGGFDASAAMLRVARDRLHEADLRQGDLEDLPGLTVARALEVDAPFTYPDVATAQRANLAAGPTRLAIEHAGLDAVRDAFSRAMQPFVQRDGSVRLDNVFRVVVAHA